MKKGLMKICTDNPLVKIAIKMIFILMYFPPGFILSVWEEYICKFIEDNNLMKMKHILAIKEKNKVSTLISY